MEQEDNTELDGRILPKFLDKVSNEATLRELLRNLNSTEVKLCSDASKKFIRLLKGDAGDELLHEYVMTSSSCSEILEAWKVGQGRPVSKYVSSLISTILAHPYGVCKAVENDSQRLEISRALDRFARSIIDQNLRDLYKELDSREPKNQKAALSLLANIVRRGSSLASDVANTFDFKFQAFIKLAEYKHKRRTTKKKHSTRRAFVGFAMSFLEVGKSGLLRWVLQQREMFSAVLRGLGDDDDETIVYALSTLRDRILVPDSLVSPGLRSVLFGSVTLENLANISSRDDGGAAAELANSVLVVVCTDPSNGLMPDLTRHPFPLRGNPKRLLDLMKKLKATEIVYHRDLLLAIVKGRPSLASVYFDEYPYNVEDHSSPAWFSAVLLAAKLISSVGSSSSFGFLDSFCECPPSFNSLDVQCVMKCICPRPFTRLVINKGLLHPNSLVKHGTLKLVFEAVKLLDCFMSAIESKFGSDGLGVQSCMSLKKDIQNLARTLLPDPQVLLSLLSSLSSHCKSLGSCLKRKQDLEPALEEGVKHVKKSKIDNAKEDVDILVSGICSSPEVALTGDDAALQGIINTDDLKNRDPPMDFIANIWDLQTSPVVAVENEETLFYSKLLDTLKFYQRTVPAAVGGSFDFFKVMPGDPLLLPIILQQSLLSLLIEVIGWSVDREFPVRLPGMLYKHLQPFINMLLYSQSRDIKDQAHVLAKAAMLSTGAFTRNSREVDLWFLFLPSYSMNEYLVGDGGLKVLQDLFTVVVTFVCDAVSTTGNNLAKYWSLVRCHTYCLEDDVEDVSPEFSPLVICVLEKCLRVLSSESGNFSLSEKTIISLYVCNTIKYILQTQVDGRFLSLLIDRLLSERVEERCSLAGSAQDLCEWRSLMNLLLFSRGIENQKTCGDASVDSCDSSFRNVLSEVKRSLRSGRDSGLVKITKAFVLSLISTPPAMILQNFPAVMCVSRSLFGVPFSMLLLIFSLEPNSVHDISKLWPKMFYSGIQCVKAGYHVNETTEERSANIYNGSTEFAAVAFCSFIRQAPFQVLAPMILSSNNLEVFEVPLLATILLAKLSDFSNEYVITLLRLLLFQCHQIRLSYSTKPSAQCESLFVACFTLMDPLLSKLFVDPTEPGYKDTTVSLLSNYMIEAAEIINYHPVVLLSLECPLENNREFPKGILGKTLDEFLHLTAKEMQHMDYRVLNLLPGLPEKALTFCNHHRCPTEFGHSLEEHKISLLKLVKKVLDTFKVRFDDFVKSGDLKPLSIAFYILHNLIHFISPNELFELAGWMFQRIGLPESLVGGSTQRSAMSFGLWISGCAFDMLSSWLQQQTQMRYIRLWLMEVTSFDYLLFENLYFRIVKITMHCEIDAVDQCLLKAFNVANVHKVGSNQCLSLSMDISKVIINTPTELISHIIYKTSRTRAKILSSLIDISPVHLSIFVLLLSEMMNKYVHLEENIIEGTCKNAISDDNFLLLLPAALSLINSTFVKYKEDSYKCFRNISSFYCTILLRNFSKWRSFVSGDLFKVEYDKPSNLSMEDNFDLVSGSLLANTVLMLQNHFALNEDAALKSKKLLKLFNSICPDSLYLDSSMNPDNVGGFTLSLDIVNRIIAKVQLCRVLLFPKVNQICSEVGPSKLDSSRISFMNMLVGMWDWTAANHPVSSGKFALSELHRLLEAFLLRIILELTQAMGTRFIDQHLCTQFVLKLARSTLLNRFDDPSTLKMLRFILTSLSDIKLNISVLKLLLAHSQFSYTIRSIQNKSDGSQFGGIIKPMPGILRFLVIPSGKETASYEERKPLEVVKLLRSLFSSVAQKPGFNLKNDVGMESRELLLLLLSSYGATLSEIDLELYNLLVVLESGAGENSGSIADMDFLWGSAAENTRKLQDKIQCPASDKVNDIEAIVECRRSQFRENLPIDCKICANTVLNFPYNRTVPKESVQNVMFEMNETHNGSSEKIQSYDPVYVLRFSIHCLSMDYIEPKEFASLGLLAIAFVSISSPDEEMRKLGYEALGRFKTALEKGQKRKDKMPLWLLLMHIQNGIEESWQRIPSVIAVFAAEASCILLDPLHDHYSTISKLMLQSPRVNMKTIPLFQSLFWSSFINSKSDRLWILRLLYAGINSDDDGQLYIRNNVIEALLSFYVSHLSENESKELILQLVKKSIKLRGMSRYMVEQCGLILWLSSVVSFFCGAQYQDRKNLPTTRLITLLEVLKEVISRRDTIEWLQKLALEQLSELSSQLYRLLVSGNTFRGKICLLSSILQILTSTLEISQKRTLYQPHFTLSVEGIIHIYEAVDKCRDGNYCQTAKLGLKAVLMSAPPVAISSMGEKKLAKFLNWATSTAIESDSIKMRLRREHDYHLIICSEEEQFEEDSLVFKLLHWLIVSVIFQRHSNGSLGLNFTLESSDSETLLSLLTHTKEECGKLYMPGNVCEDVLSMTIFHLQLLLGTDYRLLPPVISALCLLLFPDLSHIADMRSLPGYQNDVLSLLARVRCPIEVNPAWRWSFYQQWEDFSSKYTVSQKLDELQACRSLLLIISNILGKKKSFLHILSQEDVEKSGVFDRERSLIVGE